MRCLIVVGLLCASLAGELPGQTTRTTPTQQLAPPVVLGLRRPLLTALPLAATDFRFLIPLGNLNPTGHVFPTDHHYLTLQNPAARVPAYAPGSGQITSARRSQNLTRGYTDYSLRISVHADVELVLMHLSSLTPELATMIGTYPSNQCQTYSTGGETYRQCHKTVSIPIAAGALLGTAGGIPRLLAFDLGVYDRRVNHAFSNPSRFRQDYRHAVPCLSYYDPHNSALLRTRCAGWSGFPRRVEPVGGTVAQDLPGRAQGIWFLAGTTSYPEDPHLALVHDNIAPTVAVFSVGTSIPNLAPGTYPFQPLASGQQDRDFAAIPADGLIYLFTRFAGHSGVLLLRLIDATHLHVERQAIGSGPPWVMTAAYTAFER